MDNPALSLLPRVTQFVAAELRSRADARRELLWNLGRILLTVTFFGVYFRDPGDTADLLAVTGITLVGIATSVVSTVLIRKDKTFHAYLLGTASDLLGFFLGWTALMLAGPIGTSESDGWLSLFPVLISMPYRLGSTLGVITGVVMLAWIGALHVMVLPSDSPALVSMPFRWSVLTVTLVISAAFNSALARSHQALAEQTSRVEYLKGQNEAKNEFIDTISHELRTPITVIVALLRRMARNSTGNLEAQQIKHIDVAVRNADHLSNLISDLLEVTRLEHGKIAYRYSEIKLADFVSNNIDNIQPVLSQRCQTLVLTSRLVDLTFASDSVRLTQVMNNLLSNASKYSESGSEIAVSVLVDDSFVTITVTNPAPGLDETVTENMFEMFYRADNEQTRLVSGTGLGLHISRRIVEGLGGRISAHVADGSISVRFCVPLYPVAPASTTPSLAVIGPEIPAVP